MKILFSPSETKIAGGDKISFDKNSFIFPQLFEKRMALSKSVIEYKIENHLEIFQPEREREVIEKNLNRLNNDQLKEYARCFIQEMMTVSKSYQSDIHLPYLYGVKCWQ